MTDEKRYREDIETNLKWLIGAALHNFSAAVMTGEEQPRTPYDMSEAIGCLFIEVNEFLKALDKDKRAWAECRGVLQALENSVQWDDDIGDEFRYKWTAAVYATKTILKLAKKRHEQDDLKMGVEHTLSILIRYMDKYKEIQCSDHNSFVRHIQKAKDKFYLNKQINDILENVNKREG